MTLTDQYIEQELAAIKSILTKPMMLKELRGVFGIKALERKLKQWVIEKEIYACQRLLDSNWTWYFTLEPMPEIIESKVEVKIKSDPDAPSEKWVEQNGNSRIIRPTLNINYGHQMSLYRKTKQEVWVASSLSSF